MHANGRLIAGKLPARSSPLPSPAAANGGEHRRGGFFTWLFGGAAIRSSAAIDDDEDDEDDEDADGQPVKDGHRGRGACRDRHASSAGTWAERGARGLFRRDHRPSTSDSRRARHSADGFADVEAGNGCSADERCSDESDEDDLGGRSRGSASRDCGSSASDASDEDEAEDTDGCADDRGCGRGGGGGGLYRPRRLRERLPPPKHSPHLNSREAEERLAMMREQIARQCGRRTAR